MCNDFLEEHAASSFDVRFSMFSLMSTRQHGIPSLGKVVVSLGYENRQSYSVVEGADLGFSTVIIRQNAVDSVKPLFYGSASQV
jgi:hypothetical protein